MLFWLTFLLAALAMVKATPTLTIRPLSCSTIFPTFWHLLNPSDSSLPNSVNPLFSDGSSSSGVMTIKQSNDGSTKPHPFSPKLKLSPAVSTLSRQLILVDFEIPPTAYGCEVSITDQAYTISGNPTPLQQINVISLRPNAFTDTSNSPTYDQVFNADANLILSHAWGTISLAPGDGPAVINSGCALDPAVDGDGHMQFVFEISDQTLGGEHTWSINQTNSVWDGNGLYMTHNC
jgi:hypothetical protein